jgi:hypothetical protein
VNFGGPFDLTNFGVGREMGKSGKGDTRGCSRERRRSFGEYKYFSTFALRKRFAQLNTLGSSFTPGFPSSHRACISENLNNRRVPPLIYVINGYH